MSVRILVRVPGRADVILDLVPNHYERVNFTQDGDTYVYPPHVSVLLLDDGAGYIDSAVLRYIAPQRPPVVEQLGLGDLAGGAR